MRKLSLFILLITGCNSPAIELLPASSIVSPSNNSVTSNQISIPVVAPTPSPTPTPTPSSSPVAINHFIYVLGASPSAIYSYHVDQSQVFSSSLSTTAVSSGALLTMVDTKNEHLLVLGSKLDLFRIDSSNGQLTWMVTISNILNPMQVKSVNFNPDHLSDVIFNGISSGHTFSVDYSSTNPSQAVTLDETAYPSKAVYNGTPLNCVAMDRWGYKILDDTYKNILSFDTWNPIHAIQLFIANNLKSIGCF